MQLQPNLHLGFSLTLSLSLSAISSILLSQSPVAQANQPSQANQIAQADPNTGFTGVQIPFTSITPVNGRVTIHFINETGSAIDYQVIDDTEYRSLPGRSQTSLDNLPTPTTFTFRRADNGFLQVTVQPDSPQAGSLTMRVRETPNFAADRTTVYVDQHGSVYLN